MITMIASIMTIKSNASDPRAPLKVKKPRGNPKGHINEPLERKLVKYLNQKT